MVRIREVLMPDPAEKAACAILTREEREREREREREGGGVLLHGRPVMWSKAESSKHVAVHVVITAHRIIKVRIIIMSWNCAARETWEV
jgi:hypothetical protein